MSITSTIIQLYLGSFKSQISSLMAHFDFNDYGNSVSDLNENANDAMSNTLTQSRTDRMNGSFKIDKINWDSVDITNVIAIKSRTKGLRCYKQINLSSFRNNVKAIQRMAAKTGYNMIAVLKADAYGHGAIRLGHECLKLGINAFSTATVLEGIQLRKSSKKMMDKNIKIIVLGASNDDEFDLYAEYNLDLMLSGSNMTQSLIRWAKQKKNQKCINVHCMMDTGMGRMGFHGEDCLDSIKLIQQNGNEFGLKFIGLCTHFSDSLIGEYTLLQFDRFTSVLSKLESENIHLDMFHCENSKTLMANIIQDKAVKLYMNHDTKGYVRAGSAIYGFVDQSKQKIKALISLHAQIRHIAEIKRGEPVGYARSFIAQQNCFIATLSIGYADGYPRGMSNQKQCVRIGDYLYDVAGKVCMDMMMVNLGNIDKNPQIKDIKVGDYAVLFGPKNQHKKNLHLNDMSKMLGSQYNAWQITCGLTSRCHAVYVKDGDNEL